MFIDPFVHLVQKHVMAIVFDKGATSFLPNRYPNLFPLPSYIVLSLLLIVSI